MYAHQIFRELGEAHYNIAKLETENEKLQKLLTKSYEANAQLMEIISGLQMELEKAKADNSPKLKLNYYGD